VGLTFTNGIFASSYCLKDALVSSLTTGASAGEDRPSENVTINFARITYKVGTSSFSWSIVDNGPDANPC
jgi:hypothetical protein